MGHVELYDRIVESYLDTNSVKVTAEELGTSVIKVRKVLITEGLWSSPTSRKIMELIEEGLSTKEIAERLNYTEKNVQAFSPYTKGEYGRGNKSYSSLRSKEYRERKQQAAGSQVGAGVDKTKKYIRAEELHKTYGKRPVALKLHLELDLDGCSAEELDILRKYGKAEHGISRDIIVPADITLHSLHYAIQKLFGWQNSHLHHYEFPDEVFDKLTEGRFSRWCSLAGIYFRFPDEEWEDLYWDDDYEPDKSINSWFKSKYKGPYSYGGLGDYYYENQRKVQELKRDLPTVRVWDSTNPKQSSIVPIEDIGIDDFSRSVYLGESLTCLLERLTLMEYLYLPHNDYFKEPIDEKIRFYEDKLDTHIELWNALLEDIEENFEQFCLLATLSTVRMQAQSSRISYSYDPGGFGWKVSIELNEAYYKDCLDGANAEIVQAVLSDHSPVCVSADGLPVLDDRGGIHRYIEILETINCDPDEREREYQLAYARSLGWTGRVSKPQYIL